MILDNSIDEVMELMDGYRGQDCKELRNQVM
jgi:hypothetical protein